MSIRRIVIIFSQLALLLWLAVIAACAPTLQWSKFDAQITEMYPGDHWVKLQNPEEFGWSTEYLSKAQAFSEKIGSTAVMIVHRGVVVDAWGQIATKSNVHSGRKSLLSGLIGVAVDRGEMKLSQTLADLNIDDNEPSLTESEKSATVGDLIKARSGVYHAALYETPHMTASKPARESHAPGSYWHYNNWDFNTLGTIYEQQTGRKIFEAFKQDFADPLHMEDYVVGDGEYVTGTQSIHPAYPFRMTSRDLGRFALLYLRAGHWKENQILSESWVQESTMTHSHTGLRDGGYGYMWWTGEGEGFYQNVKVKTQSYRASGWGGQEVFVLPYLDLIVIHRVNTDWWGLRSERPTPYQIGRLLWLILKAAGESEHGPNPSIESANGQRLKGEKLKHVMTDSTWIGKTSDDTQWEFVFSHEGNLSGTYGENIDTGTWRVEGNRYCRQWVSWDNGNEACRAIAMKGKEAFIYDESGTYLGEMTLVNP